MKYIKPLSEYQKLNNDDYNILPIKNDDIQFLLDLKYCYFKDCYKDKKSHDNYLLANSDISISKKLVKNDEIIGAYFLNKNNIVDMFIDDFGKNNTYDDEWIDNNIIYNPKPLYELNGVEGVSLFIDEKYKNLGLGKMLIDSVMMDNDVDYMFGLAYKSLGNIKDWMKRSYLLVDYGSYYMIVETKGIKLDMTTFGEFYKNKYKNLNFNPTKGFINK